MYKNPNTMVQEVLPPKYPKQKKMNQNIYKSSMKL
jgi:hypothetical protein